MKFPQAIQKTSFYFSALLLMLLTFMLGFRVGQSDFSALISYYGLFFLVYLGILYFVKNQKTVWLFIGLGIVLRFILVFSFPNLSDDIYRFVWDGRLINAGVNPFNYLPSELIESGQQISGINQELFQALNSPGYYTIYPPLSQAIFALATWISPDSLYGSSVVMKSFMFLFECGSIGLMIKMLRHFQLPLKNVLIYALNPLIILEITGNLHFEGAMIFFLLLAIFLLVKSRLIYSAIAFALAIVAKLLPLMFLPFLIKRLSWKKSLWYFLILGGALILSFSPLLNATFVSNFGNSLDLYFQKFEFNASVYYLIRQIGFWIKGYNIIQTLGPILALIVLCSILYRAYKEENPSWQNLFSVCLFAICLYLFLATTIHPWYVAMPLALSIFTKFRFPVLWSGLIMLTYINYNYPVYRENLWIVAAEYSLVFGWLVYEYFKIIKPENGH